MNDRIERLKIAAALILASRRLLKDAHDAIGDDCVSATKSCEIAVSELMKAKFYLGRLTPGTDGPTI